MKGHIVAYSSEVLGPIRSNLEEELPDDIIYLSGNISVARSLLVGKIPHDKENYRGLALIMNRDFLPAQMERDYISEADALKELKEYFAVIGAFEGYKIFFHDPKGNNDKELIGNIRNFFSNN